MLFGIVCSVVNSLRTNSVYTVLVTVKEREGSKETIHVVALRDYFCCAKNTAERIKWHLKKQILVHFFKCVISIVRGIFFFFFLHFHRCVISIVHSTS